MNVQQTIHTLMYLPPRKSILIESDHGLGKSQVVDQTAQEMSRLLKKPFGFIDFRLAQCEVGDLIGMMRHAAEGQVRRMVFVDGEKVEEMVLAKNVTIHDLAEWFPQDPDSCGYLFLDELFRAPRDVQNAVFELALDYRYHFKELPMGWRVIAASNNNMDVYAGTEPDPALYDRFLKIDFRPTVPEWLAHAEKIGVHRAVTTYINKVPSELMIESRNIKAGETAPSPRSWVSLGDCLTYMAEQGQDPMKDQAYFTLLSKGYLGATVADSFVDFVKNNYKVFTPKDILNKFSTHDEMKDEFEKMEAAEAAYYCRELIKYIKEKGKLTKKQEVNLGEWLFTIKKEIAAGFFRDIVDPKQGLKKLVTHWYMETKGVQDYVCSLANRESAGVDADK